MRFYLKRGTDDPLHILYRNTTCVDIINDGRNRLVSFQKKKKQVSIQIITSRPVAIDRVEIVIKTGN